MEILVVVAIATLVYALLVAAFPRLGDARREPPTRWPYRLRKPLSAAEQTLHRHLRTHLPECLVLAHIPLARVVEVQGAGERHEWMSRIDRMTVDLLVCATDGSAVLAVEVDDGTALTPEQHRTLEVKERALRDAGIALRRFRAEAPPGRAEVRQLAFGELGSAEGAG